MISEWKLRQHAFNEQVERGVKRFELIAEFLEERQLTHVDEISSREDWRALRVKLNEYFNP